MFPLCSASTSVTIEPTPKLGLTLNRQKPSFGEAIFPTLPCSYFPRSKLDTLMLSVRIFTLSSYHETALCPPLSSQTHTETHTQPHLLFGVGVRRAAPSLAVLHKDSSGSLELMWVLSWAVHVWCLSVCARECVYCVCVDGWSYFSSVHNELSVLPTSRGSKINQGGGSAGSDLNTAGRVQTSHGISHTLLIHTLGCARIHVHTHSYTRTYTKNVVLLSA